VNNDFNYFTTWFVDDINLFNCTIRYAGTNEVATINNGAIANMRIVNCNRSPSATVWFQFPARARVLEQGRREALCSFLDQYAKNYPRQWHSFLYCRPDVVEGGNDKIIFTVGMQHRSNWQDMGGILTAKADLMCAVLEYSRREGIAYEELPKRDVLYYGGQLKQGTFADYREKLLLPENVLSGGSALPFQHREESGTLGTDFPESATGHTAAVNDNDLFMSQIQQSHSSRGAGAK